MKHEERIVLKRDVFFSENPPFPHNMLIEVTNACNHACIFCPHKKQKRKIKNLDRNLLFRILEEAYENGTREVGFYMDGEPLLYPDLSKCIEKATEVGYEYIYLTTNGVLATVDKVKEMRMAGLSSIKISINGATRSTYKKIHGKDDFEIVKKNIEDVYIEKCSAKDKFDIPIFLSFVKCEENCGEVELLYEEFAGSVDDIMVCDAEYRSGLENVKSVQSNIKPCEMIFNRIHVTSNGYLSACCSDYDGMLLIADLSQTSLKEAWNCSEFRELRRQHLEKNIGDNLCFNCLYNAQKDVAPLNEYLYNMSTKF